MPFPERLLTEGEEVVVELRPHWTSLGGALPAGALAVAALVAVSAAWPSAPAAVDDALGALVLVAALWLGVRLLRRRGNTLVITTARLIRRSGFLSRRGADIRLERVNEVSYHQSITGRVLGLGELVVDVGGETGRIVFDHVRRPAAVAGVLHEQIAALAAGRAAQAGSRQWDQPRGPQWSDRRAGGDWDRPGRGWRPDDTPPAGVPMGQGWGPGEPRQGYGRGQGSGRAPGRWDDAGERSLSDQLFELDELRRRGILTEDEFARKKAELLDRM